MSNEKRSYTGIITSTIVGLLLLSVAAWVIFNREYVVDQVTVWQYTPSEEIAAIADRASLSDTGVFYFYASNPMVDSASEFNQHCERQELQTAILGCYANRQIYIFDVNNDELDGIQEVTAAHEMLHAAWDRMSTAEQTRLGKLLEQAYATLRDPVLDERMDYYARNQPGERANELHSILGTEYLDLGQELEEHYKTYFIDRSKVVSLHATYQNVFNSLKNQADTLLQEIELQEADFKVQLAQYDAETQDLQSDYTALKARESSVDLTSQTAVDSYNAELAVLRQRSAALADFRIRLLELQETYNAKVAQYNELIGASNSLLESLDSTLAPEPTL